MKIPKFKSNSVLIQFKVHAEKFDRLSHRLSLLGSLQELGAWNIDDALEAKPTEDSHIWTVEVALPPMSRFEWVWLKSSRKDKKVQWERPQKRNRTVDCFSGVIHTVFGDREEIFIQSAACVELSTYLVLEEGYLMLVCGSTPTTGYWKLEKAVEAHEFPKKSGYWKAQVAFDAYTDLQFKWTVVKENQRNVIKTQENLPHTICGRRQWMRVTAPWMTTLSVVVDTLALDDPMDSALGRSDILIRDRKRRLEEIRKWHGGQGREVDSAASSRRNSGMMIDVQPTGSTTGAVVPPETASPSLSRKPSSARSEDLEEQIRKKQESLSKIPRTTVELGKDYKTKPPVFAIKGMGQTQMPTDSINANIFYQVPLVESGLILLIDADGSRRVSRQSSPINLKKQTIVKGVFRPEDIEKKLDPRRRSSSPPTDALVKKLSIVNAKFNELEKKKVQENGGKAELETDLEKVVPTTAPNFSMLQEKEIEKTLHPKLVERPRKSSQSPRPMGRGSRGKPSVSLYEKFQMKGKKNLEADAQAAIGKKLSLKGTTSAYDEASKSMTDLVDKPGVWNKEISQDDLITLGSTMGSQTRMFPPPDSTEPA